MLVNTLECLADVSAISTILVVSRDAVVRGLGIEHGCWTLTESGAGELNEALSQATELAILHAASAILILPADLPLIESADLDQILAHHATSPRIAAAPDRHGQGTNALLISPPDLIETSFGKNSFVRHKELAAQAGVDFLSLDYNSLILDLDVAEDLKLLHSEQPHQWPIGDRSGV